MIKVVHLISSMRRGGRERQLAGILSCENPICTSKAIIFNKSSNNYDLEYDMADKISYLGTRNFFKRIYRIIRILKSEKPELIWTWGGFEASFGILLSLLLPVRHINGSVRHGIVVFNSKQIWRLIVLRFSRHIVGNSAAGLKANGLKRGIVMYNGLDNQFFRQVDKENFLAKNPEIKSILDKGTPVFISVANLVPYKDYFTILKALERQIEKGYQFCYFIIGEGPDREAIEKDIINRNLQNHVFLLGRRQDVREMLSISTIFIHSSKGEGCSNAILEAMAAGLPIIASNTGGTSEIVSEMNGFLFEFQNTDELSVLITNCLENSDTMKQLGLNSLQIAEQRFSMATMVKNYSKIVQNIVAGKK